MSRHDDLKRLVTAWNDAWNSRDAGKLADFFTEDATYYEPALPAPMAGRSGVQKAAEKTWSEWPDAVFAPVSLTVEDPRVVIEWRSSARHRSGKVVELQGVDILEWKGDKLTSARIYYDEHGRNLELGK
jgi:steroid delta-isomerase-like uncharacterized protein